MDSNTNDHAITISLNKDLKLDWGGVLNILYSKKNIENIGFISKWNVANILDNNINSSLLFATPILKFEKKKDIQ